jgi:deoxyribonuclease IV
MTRGSVDRLRDEIGAHVSIAGGLALALDRAAALGCGTAQIFVKSHRQWVGRPLLDSEARAFAAARRRVRLRSVFAHASYLLNLAAPAAWGQAVDAFTDELERAEALGLDWVVIHPGAHLGAGVEAGITRIVSALDVVVGRTAGYRVRIALENTAGAGSVIGRRFHELARLVQGVRYPERVGVCIDTCHLFAAGYDIRTPAGYARTMEECVATVGLDRVLAFHVNDAKAPLGSGLDRHEHIGAGGLGLAPFLCLVNDPRFARTPKVLETPKEPEPTADLRNLARLRRLRRKSPQRDAVTPTRRQSARTGQAEHRGDTGAQTFWPKVTRRSL